MNVDVIVRPHSPRFKDCRLKDKILRWMSVPNRMEDDTCVHIAMRDVGSRLLC